MKYGLLIALLTLSISTSSRGEKFGTYEEVVEAAKRNQEPAYIPKLMEAFGRELALQTPDLSTPRHRQAFLLTMVSVIGLQGCPAVEIDENNYDWYAALEAARGTAWYGAWRAAMGAAKDSSLSTATAWGAAVDAALNADKHVAVDAVVDAARCAQDAAVREMFQSAVNADALRAGNAARNDLGGTVLARREAVGRIAYRVAEWKILNFIFERSAVLIPKFYEVALSHLPKQECSSIFMNEADWSAFRTKHFSKLNPAQRIFVEAWLTILEKAIKKLRP